jgi:hypothetical protein
LPSKNFPKKVTASPETSKAEPVALHKVDKLREKKKERNLHYELSKQFVLPTTFIQVCGLVSGETSAGANFDGTSGTNPFNYA